MDAVRITQFLESETLVIPELRPMIGHQVDICVTDRGNGSGQTTGPKMNWDQITELARSIGEEYDETAFWEFRRRQRP